MYSEITMRANLVQYGIEQQISTKCILRQKRASMHTCWMEEQRRHHPFLFCRYRATVIRNLPQLQKLDNVIVQPDEVADAMRRGIELIHPYDQDESIPYTNYAPPPGPPQTYQQVLMPCIFHVSMSFTWKCLMPFLKWCPVFKGATLPLSQWHHQQHNFFKVC